ncbi:MULTISPECIES: hypothetical protein [Streptomyces]|uniref:Cell wall protein n=2 Tax=Streptomyces TaxID=1883 RepID=A0A100Y7S3_9ACTN|nr:MULTISPECIES: hypothetical protein [Streptomyces]KUH39242.1 hypothetical protein ATE80_08215 [Streptomyces kanasensis]UUS32689.1 hypothetical protein NRO40_18965 [Streptomyces changanensis]
MSVARRPLLTATAAGTLLGALWFVPSANATGEEPGASESTRRKAADASDVRAAAAGGAPGAGSGTAAQQLRLADTGTGVDASPYLLGGTAFLAVGVGLVTFAVRRGAPASS